MLKVTWTEDTQKTTMQCTPESIVHLRSFKALHCYDVCSDSGYSGLFQSPQSTAGVDSCQSFSPEELTETPKENLKLTVTPKERTREPVRLLGRDSRDALPSAVTWCETPKAHKRDGMLRQRLLMCKSTTVKNDARSPSIARTDSSVGVRCEHWLSASFDTLDDMSGDASNAVKVDQDLPLSGRKRRLLFTQVRTSTLEDGKVNAGHLSAFERSVSLTETDFSESSDQRDTDAAGCGQFLPSVTKENCQSPVNSHTNILCESLSTPSFTQTPKYIRSLCEDSGFGSLTLDKSQDSSVDHDGSFQELLLPASRGNCETPNLADARWRSRLQRQHRLSTLREGGSQSEEDLADMKHHPFKHCSHSKEDEVFASDATPCSVLSATSLNNLTCNAVTSAKHGHNTPLRETTAKPEHTTPSTPAITPLRATPVNLSLTPALELVHAMCQHKAQMSAAQSPSLKEELKVTAALANTQLTFRTTMPLAGLIGRKMGVGRVDILTELKKRNLRHILAVIFSRLDSESVYRCAQVSKSWNDMIQQDKQARLRRRDHLSEVEAAVELGGAVHVSDAETRVALLKRSALKTVQAQSRTSSFCTPQSAGSTLTPIQRSTLQSASSSKRDKFLEVAKTLFSDECLRPCPRCEHPARCHSVKREGVCSRADCGFQFCTSCLCAFHGSRDCSSWSAGCRKKDSLLPGSAQSKRNIRRL